MISNDLKCIRNTNWAGGAVQRSVPQFPGTRTLPAHDIYPARSRDEFCRTLPGRRRNVMKHTEDHERHSSGPGRSTFGCDRHLQHQARFQTRSWTRLADRRTGLLMRLMPCPFYIFVF